MTTDIDKELEKQGEVIRALAASFKADLAKVEQSARQNLDRNCQSLADIIDNLKKDCVKGEESNAQLISTLERKYDEVKKILDGDGSYSEGLRLQVQQLSQKERDRSSQLKILSSLGGIVFSLILSIGWTSLNSSIEDNNDTLKAIVKNNNEQDIKEAEIEARVDSLIREMDLIRDKK